MTLDLSDDEELGEFIYKTSHTAKLLREKQEKSRLLRTFKQRKALDDPSIDSKQGMMSLDMIKSLFGNPIKKKSEVGIFQ